MKEKQPKTDKLKQIEIIDGKIVQFDTNAQEYIRFRREGILQKRQQMTIEPERGRHNEKRNI